jgi:hypothetical protein
MISDSGPAEKPDRSSYSYFSALSGSTRAARRGPMGREVPLRDMIHRYIDDEQIYSLEP